MFRKAMRCWVWTILTIVAGCGPGPGTAADPPVGEGGWLAGNTNEKFEIVARQLRGFDMAMVETGYRFTELYFEGEAGNWAAARYHAEKIGTTIRNGLERRPLRAESAGTFLNTVLPEVLNAIESEDLTLFRERYRQMLSTCNTCHRDEEVEFFEVVVPERRLTPLGSLDALAGEP